MKRLTMRIEDKVYYSLDKKPILPVEILDTPYVREVLKKLANYEDTGLDSGEIIQLKADLRDKDKDIQVLKWKIEYRNNL